MKPLALTAALLALACAVTIALAQDDPAPEPAPEPKPAKELSQAEKDALSTRAYFVLRNRCWGCHGEPGKTAYGETVALDWILDYEKLVAAKLVIPGKVKESRLIYLITLGKMPREFDAEGKPSKEGELPEAEQTALIEWVKAGAPKWPEMTFTHEWVPLAAPLWPQARVFESHQGVLCMGLDNNVLRAAVLKDGRWQELADQATGMTALPEDACVSVDGKQTSFIANVERGARAFQWDGAKFVHQGPAFSLPLRSPSLVAGPGASDLQVLTNLTPFRNGERVEYGYGGYHLLLTSDQWMQLVPGWTWGILDVTCNEAGKLLSLTTGDKDKLRLFQHSATGWEPESEVAIPAESRGAASLGRRGTELLCWNTGLAFHRAGKSWERHVASPPRAKVAIAAWDAGSECWIVLTQTSDPAVAPQTWALIPWRK